MKTLKAFALLCCLISMSSFAHAGPKGTVGGGGGDPTEMTVDTIRGDILRWIAEGGAEGFQQWPANVNLDMYKTRMNAFLAPQYVVVAFVTAAQEAQTQDPEWKVIVQGQPKSCRGFLSEKDQRPHILCSVERFPKMASEQYRLIHHEYAGLANVEQNLGAASDYTLSNQLTSFLQSETVFRLAVKKISYQDTPSSNPFSLSKGLGQGYDCKSADGRSYFSSHQLYMIDRPDFYRMANPSKISSLAAGMTIKLVDENHKTRVTGQVVVRAIENYKNFGMFSTDCLRKKNLFAKIDVDTFDVEFLLQIFNEAPVSMQMTCVQTQSEFHRCNEIEE